MTQLTFEWVSESYVYETGDTAALNIAQELYDRGLIFMVNQSVLHHFGYALGVALNEETHEVTGLSLHKSDDPDGIWFDENSIINARRKLRKVFG